MNTFVIVESASITGSSALEQVAASSVLYVRRIEADKRRGMYGTKRVRLTSDPQQARTWKTATAAAEVAKRHSNAYVTYEVRTLDSLVGA